MRAFLVIGAALALGACGDRDTRSDEANMTADNMMVDQNMAMDPAMNRENNMAVDSETQNMMMTDMNTNDPDTNLANGM